MPFNKWVSVYNIRNSDIDSYIDAIRFLINKGYTVVRVGSIVSKPISWSHPKLIDYPISGHRCDFLDIFLVGNCKFFLGGSSGIADVAYLFDIPRVNVDYAEFGYVPYGKNCLYIPKKHQFKKTGKYLRFQEAFELKLDTHMLNGEEFGLELEDNSPQDILEATREMLARVNGDFRYSLEEEKLMADFQKLWSQSDVLCKNVPTPIGIEWLKKNKDLYF